MGYTSPSTQGASSVIPTSRLNAYKDGLDWIAADHPRCRVYNSANISHATSGTEQAVTFNSERVDVGGCHSTSSNTSRLTVPTGGAGIFLIGGCVTFAASGDGNRELYIRLNGTTKIWADEAPSNAGFAEQVTLPLVTFYPLAAGDYVELVANQTSGGALNMLALANYSPEFWFTWIATA